MFAQGAFRSAGAVVCPPAGSQRKLASKLLKMGHFIAKPEHVERMLKKRGGSLTALALEEGPR